MDYCFYKGICDIFCVAVVVVVVGRSQSAVSSKQWVFCVLGIWPVYGLLLSKVLPQLGSVWLE